jgi:hypothetical protein
MRLALAIGLALLAGSLASAQQGSETSAAELKNGFNYPFFQFTAAVADCPTPLGPFMRADELALEALRRVDQARARSNTYDYDADIAAQLKAALEVKQLYTHSPLVNSSLWATVQGRIVTIEGCMAGDAYTSFDHGMITTQIENVAKAIPNVLQAVVLVRTSGQTRVGAPVPYPVRP